MPTQQAALTASSRNRLLQAAKRLFAANGYEYTSTSAIARDAGTSESQLMRYFGGKSGLLEALFDEAWHDLNGRVTRVVDAAGSPREAITNLLQTITSVLARDPNLATLFLFEGRRVRGHGAQVRMSGGFIAFAEVARSLVRKGQAAREFDPRLDGAAVTSAIIGATEGMIRDRIIAKSGGSRGFADREIQRTLESMLAGFAPTHGRTRKTSRVVKAR
ncbi:MAG TPA: TetR/AcrR family transcriptional regulator [Vicinamibacterales bacterium]|nr:TetR/AcrR family transcriptional regulator [Vicinamibacterales bacterium]